MKRLSLVFLALFLSSCVTYVGFYFDGQLEGRYIYQAEVDGVPATVRTVVTMNVKATPRGDSAYEFAGEITFLEQTYQVEGRETYPPGIKNLSLPGGVPGVSADVLEDGVKVFKLCGPNSYHDDEYPKLSVYPASETACKDETEKVADIDFGLY